MNEDENRNKDRERFHEVGGLTYEVYRGKHVDKECGNEDHPEGEATLTGRYGFDVALVAGVAGLERRVAIIDHVSATEQGGRRAGGRERRQR